MTDGALTQLVVFHTRLGADTFTQTWEPTARAFLANGLSVITLAELDSEESDGIGFVSRNTWPAADYYRAFPSGLAADGRGGAITVRQGGVFSVHPVSPPPVAAARPDADLTLGLLAVADLSEADRLADALLAALHADPAQHPVVYQAESSRQRYAAAVTVHGPRGTGAETAAFVRDVMPAQGVVLSGRELLSLTP